jgi:hypothetical protein
MIIRPLVPGPPLCPPFGCNPVVGGIVGAKRVFARKVETISMGRGLVSYEHKQTL